MVTDGPETQSWGGGDERLVVAEQRGLGSLRAQERERVGAARRDRTCDRQREPHPGAERENRMLRESRRPCRCIATAPRLFRRANREATRMALAENAGGVTAEDLIQQPPAWRARAAPGIGGASIVAEGELDLAAVGRLEELAQALAVVPGEVVRVDFRPVGFIDASIVAFLLRLHGRAAGVSARLEIAVQPHSGVHRTLTVCGACEILNLV